MNRTISIIEKTLASMRVRRWVKNVVFFAALLFSKGVTEPIMLQISLTGFALLCLVSGGLYIVNDLFDMEKDRAHPMKRRRPLASGKLPVPVAVIAGTLFIVLPTVTCWMLDKQFGIWITAFVLLGVLYSALLQHVAILDLFAQAFSFLLRIVAGAVLIHVPMSKWLLLCSLLLSLFIVLSRHRFEVTLDGGNGDSKESSGSLYSMYSPYLIDQMVAVVTSATLIAYTLYTFAPETTAKVGSRNLIFTIPFVLYGIFRYLYIIYQKGSDLSPEREILLDRPILLNSILYLIVAGAVLYLA